MILLRERNMQLFHEVPEEIKMLPLYGDQIRLQLILSNFLLNVVRHAPSSDGWVEIKVSRSLKLLQDANESIHLQFRFTHPDSGIPTPIIQDMFDGESQWSTQEGLVLNLSKKLLGRMNGNVRYVRELDRCYFLVDLELNIRKPTLKGSQSEPSRITSSASVKPHI